MKWHLREKELPEENRLVIIYVPNRPWLWTGKGDIHYVIAWLEKRHQRNIFDTFGPDAFREEEVMAWSYFEEYKGEKYGNKRRKN